MKKVLISGYYGFGNTGDEAILSAMVTSLKSEVPNAEITVASYRPFETEAKYGVKAIPRSVGSVRQALKKSDLFISGGGGLLQDVTSIRSLVYYCSLLLLARLERVPIMIYGQGIGPLNRYFSRFLTKLAISGANVIAVRDEGSKKMLQQIGVRREVVVTGDPALLLKPVRMSRLNGLERPIVGFALRAWRGIEFGRIAAAADSIKARTGSSIVFIPFHAKRDDSVAEQITARMKEPATVINGIELPAEVMGVIGELDVLVGMRLHSNIFAALQGIPFLPVAYDPKVDEFSKAVGAHAPIACRDLDEQKLVPEVERLLALDGNWGYSIEEARGKARQNALLAKQLLKERYILGVRFDAFEMDEAIAAIEDLIKEGKPHLIVTLNAEMMVMAKKDAAFRKVLQGAHLVVPDSIGIVWAGKLRTRVPGIDMIEEMAKVAVRKGYRIYMVGSEEGIAQEAALKLQERYPGLNIVGIESGFFSNKEESGLVERIRQAAPDILLVGLGMGKQEKWIAGHLHQLGVPACIGVGGSFDVIAGQVKRAPEWVRGAGLEWLYRFAQQPTRFKRILALPRFVYLVIRERGLM
ncbi:MAG: polysaccharide pyruvyl transferase CsaB [Actinomycetota bacterium]|nr:polysaccharide pyruvyl transferase CsaB [Actinomycetota bacterium]